MDALFNELAEIATREDRYALLSMGLGVFGAVVALFFLRDPDYMDAARLERMQRRQALIAASALRTERRDRWLRRFAPYLEPTRASELKEAQLMLLRAGYRSRFALRLYYLLRASLALTFGIVGAIIGVAFAKNNPIVLVMLCGALGGMIGYFGPSLFVLRQKQARQIEIRNGFPDSLDMLLVCVEAGQGVEQAVGRVAVEIQGAHPILANELGFLSAQLRAGLGRSEAMRDFALRVDLPETSSFSTVIIQSGETGTSIGNALRVYAAEMREKRRLRAEERANVLPVKLALGTMAFTVPPLMLMLLGPAILSFLEGINRVGVQ